MGKFINRFILVMVLFLLIPLPVLADEQAEHDGNTDVDELTDEQLQYVPKAKRDGESFDDSYLHSDEEAPDVPHLDKSYPDVNKYIENKNLQTVSVEYDHIDFLPEFPYRNGEGAVEGVVAHETANNNSTIDTEINWMKTNFTNAFVHAFVDHERIVETHPLDYAAWGAGPVANERFIHVELVNVHTFDDFARSINNYADYIAGVLFDYDLDVTSAESDGKGTLWSHKAVSEFLGGTNHVDPHGYFSKYGYKWNDFVNLVKEKYDGKSDLDRISGKDRYQTSVAISKKGWDKSNVVILARGDEYADALAGVPLAKKYDAPMLLTQPDKFTEVTKNELSRLGAKEVFILGEKKAISKKIENELMSMGLDVERLAGSDRTDTAADIADELTDGNATERAVLVNGYDFPDALSVASYAAEQNMPILLTQENKLPEATSQTLSDLQVEETVVIGGEKVISSKIENRVPESKRVKGADRFKTAVAIAEHFPEAESNYYITTGMEFPDALSGAALAAKDNTGILLVHSKLPEAVSDFMTSKGVDDVVIIGGLNAVNTQVEQSINGYLR